MVLAPGKSTSVNLVHVVPGGEPYRLSRPVTIIILFPLSKESTTTLFKVVFDPLMIILKLLTKGFVGLPAFSVPWIQIEFAIIVT